MGLMGRIRHWVGRHWCRDLAELREQVQLSRALMKFLSRVHMEGQSGGTDRERERIKPPP